MKNNKRLSIVSIILTILMVTVFMAGCEIDEIPNTATPDEKYISSTTADKATAASEVPSESVSEAATETQDKNNTKATEANTGKTTTTSPTEKNSNNTGNNNSTSSKPSNGSSGSGSSTSSKPSEGNSTSSNSGGSSSSSKPSDSGNSGGSGSSTSSKTWHEAEYEYIEHPAEYQDVWVVDQEAYSYEEPVYEYHGHTFCNQCGTDITGWVADHMQSNEGSCWSYHSERVKEQVGTRTVDVPEQGHWEKQKVKDAWTEKRLVREAGYY